MKPRHQVSRQAIELIKSFEGYRRTAAALADGRWTIGYGHTKSARVGAEIPESDAEALLIYDLLEVTKAVNDWTFTPLTQNQFDALVCFAFNVGLENFRRSTVLRRINEGAMLQAACALEMWRKAEFEGERIVVDALVRRRAAEKSLFLTPTHGWVPAPSPVVRPRVDYDASAAQPKQRPLSLIVPLDGDEANAHEEVVAAQDGQPDEVSPATTAAENLAARLQALVPDAAQGEDTAEAEAGIDLPSSAALAPVEDEPEPTVAEIIVPTFAPDAAFALTSPAEEAAQADEPPEEITAIVDTESRPLPFSEPIDVRARPANAAPEPRLVAEEPVSIDTPAPPRKTDFSISDITLMTSASWPLVVLIIVGLASFVFAILRGLFAEPGGGVFGAWTVSWAAGLIGIGCVVGAVYMLLERLGGSEE